MFKSISNVLNNELRLHVFQRYGYDGFVQLHHRCKASNSCFFPPLFFLHTFRPGHRHSRQHAYAIVLRALLGTQQVFPTCTPSCGPVRLVLAMWAAAQLSTVPLHQQSDSLQTLQNTELLASAKCTCGWIVECVTQMHTNTMCKCELAGCSLCV